MALNMNSPTRRPGQRGAEGSVLTMAVCNRTLATSIQSELSPQQQAAALLGNVRLALRKFNSAEADLIADALAPFLALIERLRPTAPELPLDRQHPRQPEKREIRAMPRRIVDGEALWTSGKLRRVEPEKFRLHCANWLPMAEANGVSKLTRTLSSQDLLVPVPTDDNQTGQCDPRGVRPCRTDHHLRGRRQDLGLLRRYRKVRPLAVGKASQALL